MRSFCQILRRALVAVALLLPALPAAAVELVMVEKVGCIYCARWNEEIGPIYPISQEGAFAPLRQIDIGDEALRALTLDRKVVFTPTFLLIDDSGTELARIEGYPGEDFFWPLLDRMLREETEYEAVEAAAR